MAFSRIVLTPGPSHMRPVVSLPLASTQSFIVQLYDADGAPLDLARYSVTDATATTIRAGYTLPIMTGILMTAKQYYGQAMADLTRAVSTDTDPTTGDVILSFEAGDFSCPGIYLAELQMVFDGKIETAYQFNIELSAPLSWIYSGPLNIAEVRLWSRDNSPDDNYLLDEVEYKDAEIIAAIRRAVDVFNSLSPVLPQKLLTVNNFPFRSQWIDATIGYLMEIAALNKLRNDMNYNAGGLSIDDRRKWGDYMAVAKQKQQEFKELATLIKAQMNAMQTWSSSGRITLS